MAGRKQRPTVCATTLYTPAWDSNLPVWAGVECWTLGSGEQTQGEDQFWLCRNSLKGLECGKAAIGSVQRSHPVATEAKLLRGVGCQGRVGAAIIASSFMRQSCLSQLLSPATSTRPGNGCQWSAHSHTELGTTAGPQGTHNLGSKAEISPSS